MARATRPFLRLGFLKGVDLGLEQTDGETKPETVYTAKVREEQQLRSLVHAAEAVKTTTGKLQTLLDQALAEGWGPKKLASAISAQYRVEAGYRPLLTARTELTGAINDGTLKTLSAEGWDDKEWSTVIDGRERESHAQAHGQVVPVGSLFTVGGFQGLAPGDDALPISETANCRCTVLGAGLSETRRHQCNQSFLRTHGAIELHFVVSLRRYLGQQRDRVLARLPSD